MKKFFMFITSLLSVSYVKANDLITTKFNQTDQVRIDNEDSILIKNLELTGQATIQVDANYDLKLVIKQTEDSDILIKKLQEKGFVFSKESTRGSSSDGICVTN